MTLHRHATNLVDIVYGNEKLRFNDPCENFFESTKIYRPSMSWDSPGVAALMGSPELQLITMRAGKRYTNRPFLPLPDVPLPDVPLSEVLTSRRSEDVFGEGETTIDQLAAVLDGGYGFRQRVDGPRRTVPSAGGLYALDLYVVVRMVSGLALGLYHFDPYRHGLAALGAIDDTAVLRTMMREEDLAYMSFAVVISGSFWRARFKYGARAYRFIFLDAGHAMQNLLLTCTGLGLGSRPYGGFIDDELTNLMVGQNGVDEAPLYVLAAGPRGN